MLAKLGEPFDSPEHLFEVKWDGTRGLAFVEGGDYRFLNRRERDLKARYPELAGLAGLPAGCAFDGEVVILEDGKPSFSGMLRREQAAGERRFRELAGLLPATYVVFDLLYAAGESLLERPLRERRERLEEALEGSSPNVVLSTGVVEQGLALFESVREQALEGIVAKRLDSAYVPGARDGAWVKCKPRTTIPCLVMGYQLDESRALKSLVVAARVQGELRCVGKVGSGLTEAHRRELLELFREHAADAPLLPTELRAEWLQPGLYCSVSYTELTGAGSLRAPVFHGMLSEP